jgi:T3SS negative regulator,GrlR
LLDSDSFFENGMESKLEQRRSVQGNTLRAAVSTLPTHRAILASHGGRSMKNGLYSIHIHMLDGVKGRDSGVLILRDGVLLGGGPYFWSRGSYVVGNGTWKGELATNQHSPFADPLVRPLFAGTEATSGFSGTFSEEGAEVYGTVLVAGHRSLGFRASLKWLAEA